MTKKIYTGRNEKKRIPTLQYFGEEFCSVTDIDILIENQCVIIHPAWIPIRLLTNSNSKVEQ